MKKTIITLLVFMGCMGSQHLLAQDFTIKNVPWSEDKKLISYNGEIEASGIAKDSLYRKTFASLKAMYRGFSSKLAKNDPVEGRIIYNGIMQTTAADKGTGDAVPDSRVRFQLVITVTDGKVMYNYSNFVVEKGKKRPLESYYYNEPEVKKSKAEQEDFFHSIDYQMKSDITSLTRKVTN